MWRPASALVTFLRGDADLVSETGHAADDIRIARAGKTLGEKLPMLTVTHASSILKTPSVDNIWHSTFYVTAFAKTENKADDILYYTRSKLKQDTSQADVDISDSNVHAFACHVTSETGTLYNDDGDYWQATLVVEVIWYEK